MSNINMARNDKFVTGILSVIYVDRHHHPLHLGLERDIYNKLFGEEEKLTVVSVISRELYDRNVPRDSEIHVCVVPLDSKPGAQQGQLERALGVSEPKRIRLICTQQFLQLYGFDAGCTVLVRKAGLLPTDKIIISAKSQNAFHWAQQRVFSTSLLLSVCQNKVLVRKGDPLLMMYSDLYSGDDNFSMSFLMDLIVIDAAPLNQGLLTVHTEILICIDDKENIIEQEKLAASPELRAQAVKSLDHFKKNIQIPMDINVDYNSIIGLSKNTLRSLRINNDTLVYVFYKIIGEMEDETANVLETEKEKPSPSREKSETEKVEPSPSQEKSEQVECSPAEQCVRSPGKKIKQKDYSELRLCRAVGYNNAVDNIAYMLPSLLFNLKKGNPVDHKYLLSIEHYNPGKGEGPSLLSALESLSVPYATEVHINLVTSPVYSSTAPYISLLHLHFQCTRYLKEGDVITLKTSEDPEYGCEQQERTEEVHPVVYFKVTKIKSSAANIGNYKVDVDNSTLYQGPNVHSYVPITMGECLDQRMQPPPAAVAGLITYVDRLTHMLQPNLINSGEGLATFLISGPVGSGKSTVAQMLGSKLGLHILKINCHNIGKESPGASEARIKNTIQQALAFSPCILLMRNIHAICKDRDGHSEDPRLVNAFKELLSEAHDTTWPLVVIATTSSPSLISGDLQEMFLHTLNLEVPDEAGRMQMLSALLDTIPHADNSNIKYLAQRTAGFVLGDLVELVNHAKRSAVSRLKKSWIKAYGNIDVVAEAEIASSGPVVTHDDLTQALDAIHNTHSQSSHTAKIPHVSWDDVGGLGGVKAEILDTIQLPLQQPHLFAAGLRRSGVLLYGPPGTGKTLLAKAVATECSLNFLSVKGPELINMYVGQSEENVREVFSQARNAAPCVIFFDELDSLAPNRGRSGDSGGVMDRVVSQLLAELDGLHKSCDVFVIGATNRPDLLDPALLRPGRFDKLLYLGISKDPLAKLKILQALTRKFKLKADCDLKHIAENCPENLTGADLYALSSDAMLNAIKRQINVTSGADREVEVSKEDFMCALESLVPSVAIQEMLQYDAISKILNTSN